MESPSDAIAREVLAACGSSRELAEAFVSGLMPFLPVLGPATWAAESKSALGELRPLLEAARVATAPASPNRRRVGEAGRAVELLRLAAYARLCVPYAESRGLVAPPDGPLVSPYDGSRISLAELEAGLASRGFASGAASGAAAGASGGSARGEVPSRAPSGGGDAALSGERHRAAFARYASALLAKGLAFAASALAAEARPLEPGELWFATVFRELALFLVREKGVDIAFVAAIIRDAYPKNGFAHREAALVLSDFLFDERYSADAIEPLLSFIRSCALILHPERTAAFAKVLRLAKDFVRLGRSTDEKLMGVILKTFLEHPYLDLGEWVGEGARIVRLCGGDSPEARAFFDRSSEASLKIWEAIDVGIPFEKAAPRLRPFAAALSGKSVALAKSPEEAGKGHIFMTDGQTVFVPAYAMYVKDRESNYLMLRHGAAHECAHIEFGSFKVDEDRFRAARGHLERLFPGASERNEAILKSYRARVARALERMGYEVASSRGGLTADSPPMARLYFMTDFPMLYRDLVNIVEDRRVNALLYSRYPGYRAEKARVDEMDLGQLPELSELPEEARFVQAFLERLLLGRVKGQLPEGDEEVVDELVRDAEAHDPFASDIFDSGMAGGDALRVIIRHMGSRYPKALGRMRSTGNRLDVTLVSLGTRSGERNGLLEFELAGMRGGAGPGAEGRGGADGKSVPERAAEARKAAAFTETLHSYGQVDFCESLAGHPLFVYPEWVDYRLAYDREACLLAELPVGFLGTDVLRAEGDSGETLRSTEGQAAEAVRRAFASMKENLDVLERGAEDGEDIDFDRAVDCFMDFASGGRVDMDFYLRRTRKARDLACALVLDMSPSTSQKVEGRTIFRHEVSAAYLMAEAMAAIGDSFGIFSYYDFGARANVFHVIKDFDTPYDYSVVDELAALRPAARGFSRIAPGLRHIIAKMSGREARAKIIFLVTDGQPVYLDSIFDEGKTSSTYYVDGREVVSPVPVRVRSMTTSSDDYAYADLGMVAQEARAEGIRLFCVTLDLESVSALSKVFGDCLIYLDRVSSLPARLVEIFRRMTR